MERIEKRNGATSPTSWRVLVVDDDAAVGKAILRVLRPLAVTYAQSPVGALARIEAGAWFDAIVCDIHMPGMSGPELQQQVARLAPELASRFVFITGSLLTPELRSFLGRTSNRCVEKPFEPEGLREVIAAVAGKPMPPIPAPEAGPRGPRA